ncbi:MAG: hypothetical protein ACE5FH_02995 [Candidatus Zixiibacteriota bacterium]
MNRPTKHITFTTATSSPRFVWLLNLLLPGLGHVCNGDFVFGLFVFLIMLIGVALFAVTSFVSVSNPVMLVTVGLPVLFYLFTFADLGRIARAGIKRRERTRRARIIFFAIGLAYQLFCPIALVNFGIVNRPELFVLSDNRLSPIYSEGELMKASRLDYFVEFFAVTPPILHSLPERYDIVRFSNQSGRVINGLVIGLPAEGIELFDGVLVVDGVADYLSVPDGLPLEGNWPLTSVDQFSILVATMNLGIVDNVYEVSLSELVGKVDRLFH